MLTTIEVNNILDHRYLAHAMWWGNFVDMPHVGLHYSHVHGHGHDHHEAEQEQEQFDCYFVIDEQSLHDDVIVVYQ
jgi:hypothetical protein